MCQMEAFGKSATAAISAWHIAVRISVGIDAISVVSPLPDVAHAVAVEVNRPDRQGFDRENGGEERSRTEGAAGTAIRMRARRDFLIYCEESFIPRGEQGSGRE